MLIEVRSLQATGHRLQHQYSPFCYCARCTHEARQRSHAHDLQYLQRMAKAMQARMEKEMAEQLFPPDRNNLLDAVRSGPVFAGVDLAKTKDTTVQVQEVTRSDDYRRYFRPINTMSTGHPAKP